MLLEDPLFLLAGATVLAVLVVLMIGLGSYARGGEFNRRNANRLMRYRIIAQAIAIVLVLVFVLVRHYLG